MRDQRWKVGHQNSCFSPEHVLSHRSWKDQGRTGYQNVVDIVLVVFHVTCEAQGNASNQQDILEAQGGSVPGIWAPTSENTTTLPGRAASDVDVHPDQHRRHQCQSRSFSVDYSLSHSPPPLYLPLSHPQPLPMQNKELRGPWQGRTWGWRGPPCLNFNVGN